MQTRARKTFQISPVEPAHEPLPEASARSVLERDFGVVESGRLGGRLVLGPPCNALVKAVHLAFQGHRPLVLSPDVIWLTLLQGLAHHVRLNSDGLRTVFVEGSGRRALGTRCDNLIPGEWENNWEDVFPQFVAQLTEHVRPQALDRLRASFSTTGLVEKLIAEMALLDVMGAYFDYTVYTYCGIPRLTLEGTADDWWLLRERFSHWGQFGLGHWVAALDPCLEQFEKACRGEVHPRFWRNIYLNGAEDMSGGESILTGWMTLFFPYVALRNQGPEVVQPNHLLEEHANFFAEPSGEPLWRSDFIQDGLAHSQIPASVSSIPFQWECLGESHAMTLISGLIGVEQDLNTLAVRPRCGWAVRGKSAPPPEYSSEEIMQWRSDLWCECTFERPELGRKHEAGL